MSDKKTDGNTTRKKNNNQILIAAAVVVVSLVVGFIINGKVIRRHIGGTGDASERQTAEAVAVARGESLNIQIADITTDATFFPVEVDGTQMEVIAVLDSNGKIRTAFNTCQVCYGSGRGYYVQSGDYLVCQNCGNRFSMEQVGVQSGGCNPWPIFEDDRTETDDTISISYDFLADSKRIFSNWKINY